MLDKNRQLMESPDIYTALYDLVSKFSQPPLNSDHIYRKGQKNMVRPPADVDYAIICVSRETQVGTGVELCRQDQHGPYWERVVLMKADVEIDFYSTDGLGEIRAQSLNAALSSQGQAFLKPFGFSLLYQGTRQDASFSPSKGEFVKGHRCLMHIAYELRFFLGREAAEEVRTRRQENIDIHHRPF